jgi:GAF domain-containing protein
MDDRDHDGQALQRRSYELSILNDVARALNASVDLPALLARALEKVAELLGLRTGWVLLFDETSGEPYLAAAQDLPPGLGQEPLFTSGWCYCLESFRDGKFDDAANVGVVYCSRLRKPALGKGRTAGLHDPLASHLALLYAVVPKERVREGVPGGGAGGYLWHEFGDSHLLLAREV